VFRAVIVSAGSPPTQLHTCTTTFLTLLSFFFCVQSSERYYSTLSIWDDGTTMNCEEQHVEQAIEEDSEEGSEDGRDGEYDPDRNSDDGSTTSYDEDARGREREQEDEKTNTDSENDVCEGEEDGRVEAVGFGETVTSGKDDDPLRKTWTRIDDLTEDARTERHYATVFKNLRIDSQTTELDIFLALMPLKPIDLLTIVREGGDRAKDRQNWKLEHIMAALCMIYGGAQFKEGTDLWCSGQKGNDACT
jgi:hypothetical protein